MDRSQGITYKETDVSAQFQYENILTSFDYPLTIVSNQGSHLINEAIKQLKEQFFIEHWRATTYYLQGNGQAKLTNKVIV